MLFSHGFISLVMMFDKCIVIVHIEPKIGQIGIIIVRLKWDEIFDRGYHND
jgi:hypothetical protein